MGSGRSGSTILDILLGNHPEIESVGELINVSHSGWVDSEATRSPYCSCGELMSKCPFWSSVKHEWRKRTYTNVENYQLLQESFERYRRLPRLLWEQHNPSSRFLAYCDATESLFKAIRTVSKRNVILDSSKSPVRALALSMNPEIDLRLLHLIRDERGVAMSQKKAFDRNDKAGLSRETMGRPVWKSIGLWTTFNLLSEVPKRQLSPGKTLRTRYEDLAINPTHELHRVGQLVQANMETILSMAQEETVLDVGHNVGGNRLRMTEDIRFLPDSENWRDKLSTKEQRMSWLLTGWLLRRYGYYK